MVAAVAVAMAAARGNLGRGASDKRIGYTNSIVGSKWQTRRQRKCADVGEATVKSRGIIEYLEPCGGLRPQRVSRQVMISCEQKTMSVSCLTLEELRLQHCRAVS